MSAGLALELRDHAPVASCDRKNYFYPDLPKAYQISQLRSAALPRAAASRSTTDGGEKKHIRLTRNPHGRGRGQAGARRRGGTRCVDYNRCGVPLIEIVTEPDMRSARGGRSPT